MAINAESAPGGYRDVAIELPDEGVYAHTNHFLSDHFLRRPVNENSIALQDGASTVTRLLVLCGFMRQHHGHLDRELMQSILSDHADHPWGLCAHPDLDLLAYEHWATCASLIMEPAAKGMWLAAGNPCVAPFLRARHVCARQMSHADHADRSAGSWPGGAECAISLTVDVNLDSK